jgi:DNA-binding NtrC family response regulator
MAATVTDDDEGEGTGHALGPTVLVAFHPDPRFLGARRRLRADETLLLGRDEAPFGRGSLADHRISSRHCEVRLAHGEVFVRDHASRNGTRLHGAALPAEAAVTWIPGQVLTLGPVALLLEEAPLDWSRSTLEGLIGGHPALAPLLDAVDRVAPLEGTVLVTGETGTGKELVAQALHTRSGRPGPFLAVNCGTLDAALLGSELFGHERGAFSGADRARRGLVEEATAGTLLLDEIGDASPALQTALLRVLQEREIRPVGANRVVPVGTRFVAATHRDLSAMVAAGTFRADLLARLAQWELRVPPLRERRSDIAPIALEVARRTAGRAVGLHPRFAQELLLRDWPANVRELAAVVMRAVVEAQGADPIPSPLTSGDPPPPTVAAEATQAPAPRPTADQMRERITALGGNVRAYARELGLGRSTLYRWLEAAGVAPDELRR